MAGAALEDVHRLEYRIHSCSSVSNKYFPQNILADSPQDPSSRWAGEYQSQQQAQAAPPAASTAAGSSSPQAAGAAGGGAWVLLELKKPALLRQVHFGKFHRQHPCTLKDYALFAGDSPTTLKPVKHGALRPDAKAERVDVAWREADEDGGRARVVRFVKIVPISAQGPNYNVSIWHIALFGNSDERLVSGLLDNFKRANEARTMRSILAHLRRTRHPVFPSLLASAPPAALEHPLLSALHDHFVSPVSPAWPAAEQTVHAMAQAGLFDAFLRAGKRASRWTRRPGLGKGRGGHQMVEFPPGERIWVFGGFDGREDHADLHFWDVRAQRWVAREREGDEPWPERRSCHKWVVCGDQGWMMGRYVDDPPASSSSEQAPLAEPAPPRPHPSSSPQRSFSLRSPSPPDDHAALDMADEDGRGRIGDRSSALDSAASTATGPTADEKNELWRFDFSFDGGKGRWELVSADTKSKGGPSLIYDHQMVVDEAEQALYVYGGTDPVGEHSGMYRYDIRRGLWSELFGDGYMGLQSRTGHCMLWNAARREILIFGGLHSPTYLSDFWTVSLANPDRPILSCLTPDYSKAGLGPLPAFTQRAVYDAARDEVVVLSGLMKEALASTAHLEGTAGANAGGGAGVVKSELWAFSLKERKWNKVEEQVGEDGVGPAADDGAMDVDEDGETSIRPTPRFAHQFIYSPTSDSFFLMGGNPGAASSSAPLLGKEIRLGDFWELKVERPKMEEVVRLVLLELRRRQFIELCDTEPSMTALSFLQTSLHAVFNHKDPSESATFRSLLAHLLRAPPSDERKQSSPSISPSPDDETFAARSAVFKSICARFVLDRHLKEPEEELSDLVDSRVGLVV